MNDVEHWESVYRCADTQSFSWTRAHLDVSLGLMDRAGLNKRSRVIDAGGGCSTLVDDLLDRGLSAITVLDISERALRIAHERLADRDASVRWLVADVRSAVLPAGDFDIWHDRAALHFLTNEIDARAYVRQVHSALVPGGFAIIGAFASDGPEKCSGLPVVRREPADIEALFGADFELIDGTHERHVTPSGKPQNFAYALLQKRI